MANTPTPIPRLRLVDLAYLILLAVFVVASFRIELGAMGALAGVLLVLAGFVLGIRHLRTFGKHLLWPLRNRLRVTYVFIGVVPILLIVILTALGVYIVTGEITSFLLNSELHRREGMLAGPSELVATTPAAERDEIIQRIFPYFEAQFPGLQLCARSAEGTWNWPPGNVCAFPPAGWNRTSGLVSRENRLYVWVYTHPNDTELSVMMPVTRAYLNGLVPGLLDAEIVGRVEPAPGSGSASAGSRFYRFGPNRPGVRQPGDAPETPPKANLLDFSVNWQTTLSVSEWTEPGSREPALLAFNTRPSAVWDVLSRRDTLPGAGIDFTQYFAVMLFVSASVLFLIVEACSLMAGMGLSRSITQAVENLYEGTQHVMRGQFQHRILVKGEDQLADLNRSFNRMTENLETLVAISKEKERMQSELEIAREVQVGLYPKETPQFEKIELVAMSQPARMASGDYFDYLRLEDDRIAFAIGDVAGKGISAALLMASIQSTMRAQLRPYLPPARGFAETAASPRETLSTAMLVSRLNQQIHQFTSASKFATFFFGVYDDHSGTLRYTNAGHLPPILLRRGEISRLNVDGLVVGAFSFATYEESTLHLEQGDTLVLYTDGISEPENEYGEEFGEERLHALLRANSDKDARELADLIVEAVQDWVGDAEQFDDITLLIVKKFREGEAGTA
ncbi:MAG: SpoIIE family protein phosphatase [Bryobacterales bacterium]|nr:SpoIIE family protein phosphatase [Bryobacterales bacterium]